MVIGQIKKYWETSTPMGFAPEKWEYERKRKFRYDLQNYMQDVFRFNEYAGCEVLEVGCGSGIDAVEFARSGAIVTAVDITDNAMILTKALAEEAHVLNMKVEQVPADALPYKNNFFDLVYSFGVLHHIPNVEGALTEMKRVLKKGGKIMAMLYNRNSLLYAYSILHLHRHEHMEEADLVRIYSERIEDCPYTRAYTKEEAVALFTEMGFSDVTVSVHYNVVDLPGQRKVKLGLDDKWELGWHLVLKGIKRE